MGHHDLADFFYARGDLQVLLVLMPCPVQALHYLPRQAHDKHQLWYMSHGRRLSDATAQP